MSPFLSSLPWKHHLVKTKSVKNSNSTLAGWLSSAEKFSDFIAKILMRTPVLVGRNR